jgi:endonuclease-3
VIMSTGKIKQIIHLLIKEYGYREWHADGNPVSMLVQTILSQNTSDNNSHRAFASLLSRFGDWQPIADAGINEIADSIRAGGLGQVKAHYIKQALNDIQKERGKIELDFLKDLPLEGARKWLTDLPGVGIKTANCVLLFSLGMPALPVDTHIFRVSKRLGLIDRNASFEHAHRLLENLVEANDTYVFHILLIEHGRKVCKAQRPYCSRCVLQKICPSFNTLSKLDPTVRKAPKRK